MYFIISESLPHILLKVVLRSCVPSPVGRWLLWDFICLRGPFLSLNKLLASCQDFCHLNHILLSFSSALNPSSVVSCFIFFINFLISFKTPVYHHLVSLFCLGKDHCSAPRCLQREWRKPVSLGFSSPLASLWRWIAHANDSLSLLPCGILVPCGS